jgi:hypothetical protein
MSRPLKLQIVEQARALVADETHWCRGELARDMNGVGVLTYAAAITSSNSASMAA